MAQHRVRKMSTAKVSPSVRKYVSKRLARMGEYKSCSFQTNQSVSTAGYDVSLSLIAQGAGDGARVGDKISLKSLKVKVAWFGSDAIQVCRFVVYRKTNSQAGMPIGFNDCPDPQNYHIIADWYDSCSGTLAPSSKTRSLEIPLKGTISYVGQNATDDSHGAVWIRAVTDSSTVSHPSLYLSTQLRYTDL